MEACEALHTVYVIALIVIIIWFIILTVKYSILTIKEIIKLLDNND